MKKITARNNLNLFLAAMCVLLFSSYFVLVLTKPISQDEGVFLTMGKYINQGWQPYQDLVDHKPPAIYFLFAILFKLFGPSIWAAKGALILSLFGSSVLVKKIGDSLKPDIGWYAAAIFIFLMTQFEGYFLITEPFLVLPLLLGFWFVLRYYASLWLLVAGLSLALALLFKQTAIVSVIPILWLAGHRSMSGLRWVLIGFISLFLLVIAYLGLNHTLDEAWHQVVTLNLTAYPREQLPYVLRSLEQNFLWTLPIWSLLLLAWWPYLKYKKVLWSLVLLPLPLMFFRHYPHYWIQLLPFVAILVASVLGDIRVRAVTLATIIFCLAIAGGKVGQEAATHYHVLRAQVDAAQMLERNSATTLLAENRFTGFYFLLPQKPLNRYLFITEITNADKAEQQTIDDLQNSKQPVLVLWPNDHRVYAKKLQVWLEGHGTRLRKFPELEMEASIVSP